jgi:hypothetical protein
MAFHALVLPKELPPTTKIVSVQRENILSGLRTTDVYDNHQDTYAQYDEVLQPLHHTLKSSIKLGYVSSVGRGGPQLSTLTPQALERRVMTSNPMMIPAFCSFARIRPSGRKLSAILAAADVSAAILRH